MEPSKQLSKKSKQSENERFACPDCPEVSFKGQKWLKRHINQHEKPYKCEQCASGFALRSDLNRHKTTHSLIKPKFPCPNADCPFKGTARKDNLRRHLRIAHSIGSTTGVSTATVHPTPIDEQLVSSLTDTTQRSSWLTMVEAGMFAHIRILLYQDVDINQRTAEGKMAIHIAAAKGHMETVRLLLEFGCIFTIKDYNGNTALHHAISGEKDEVATFIISGNLIDVNCRNKDGRTPISFAAEKGRDKIIALLLRQEGIEFDQTDICGRTPLLYGVKHGWLSSVQLILTKTCLKTQELTGTYSKVFYYVIAKGLMQIMRLFLDAFTLQPRHYNAALRHAASNGHRKIAQWLIFRRFNFRSTFSHYHLSQATEAAAENGHIEVLKVLLRHSVINQSEFCLNGRALHGAIISKQEDIAELLLGHCARTHLTTEACDCAMLPVAARMGRVDMVEFLLDKGAIFNTRKDGSYSALFEAVVSHHKDTVEVLLNHGADPNFGEWWHLPPLHLAARNGLKDIVELLLDKGAKADIRDHDGRTALDVATESGHHDIVDLLRNRV